MNFKFIWFRTLGGFETKMYVASPLHLEFIRGKRKFQLQKDKGKFCYQETL